MLWRFENVLRTARPRRRERTASSPLEGRVVRRIDIHDIGVGDVHGARRPIFVNTLYGLHPVPRTPS